MPILPLRSTAPDGSVSPATRQSGEVPVWDLSNLYAGVSDPAFETDFHRAKSEAEEFAGRYRGCVHALSSHDMAVAIQDYEKTEECLARLMSFAQLVFSADNSLPETGQFYQKTLERVTDISATLIFFRLELNAIDDEVFEARIGDEALAPWRSFLRDLRAFRPHMLSPELERFAHEREVTGRMAWSRLFDETVADLRIELDGNLLTLNEALNIFSDQDRGKRERVAAAVARTLRSQVRVYGLIYNTLVKDKSITDQWRGFKHPVSSRNLENLIEDDVVDALANAVAADFPRLSHRYYRLKSRWLGLETLDYWDRNAPLTGDPDRQYSWAEARRIVQDAYDNFDPSLGAIVTRFFDDRWIDAACRKGKAAGAFAHPTTPSVHPYILLNYHGRVRDVMTLAHELGHGVHQTLAATQGYFKSVTPLTLAETASVFGEMLTFQSLLTAESDPLRRRHLLAGKVEDMLNTVVRQIAFFQFEKQVHEERRQGEIVPERLGEIWIQTQRDSLGDAFRFGDDYTVYWAYIPHFIHTPFYVYAYAFGDCLVNALYAEYKAGHPGFVEKYRALLEAGGTRRHRELLAPFGLDAAQPNFWKKGLDLISTYIDQLEAL